MSTAVRVNRKELCLAFDFVKGIVPAKPIVAADGNVILRVEGDQLCLMASDGAQGARARVRIMNMADSPDVFSLGCDPKRFGKAIAKDSAEELLLAKDAESLKVSDPNEDADKYVTLACANIKRASVISNWIPSECLNNVSLPSKFFSEVLGFLDNFTPAGHDEGAKHDVVVLSPSIAHTTNGVHLRGMCASRALTFTSDVSIRKKYVAALSKSLGALAADTVIFRDSQRFISIATADENFVTILPALRKPPPVAPKEYLANVGDPMILSCKDVVKGLDRLSTSNYNSLTQLVGVDIKIFGEGPESKMQLVLDDGKAAQTFPISRTAANPVEKVLDLTTFMMLLKAFSKADAPKIYFGEEDTRFIRFVDVRNVAGTPGAFVAISAYARKT